MSKKCSMSVHEQVRERDGHKCVCCGSPKSGIDGPKHDVHRLIPGSPYALSGCVTLCKSCHGHMPRDGHMLMFTPYKGVFGVAITRMSPEAEVVIEKIRKIIEEHGKDDKFLAVYFGIDKKEMKTRRPPKKTLVVD